MCVRRASYVLVSSVGVNSTYLAMDDSGSMSLFLCNARRSSLLRQALCLLHAPDFRCLSCLNSLLRFSEFFIQAFDGCIVSVRTCHGLGCHLGTPSLMPTAGTGLRRGRRRTMCLWCARAIVCIGAGDQSRMRPKYCQVSGAVQLLQVRIPGLRLLSVCPKFGPNGAEPIVHLHITHQHRDQL